MGSARQFFIKCLEISAIYLCHSFSNNIVWFQFIGCNFTGNNVFGKNIQKQLLNADAEMLISRFPLQDPRKASVRLLFHSNMQTAILRFVDVNKQYSLRNFFTKKNRICDINSICRKMALTETEELHRRIKGLGKVYLFITNFLSLILFERFY